MDYTLVKFDGVPLMVPIINGKPFDDWAADTCKDYPSFCGAGSGIGDWIVPDRIWLLKVSVACHIHDLCWELAEPTSKDLVEANRVFLSNLMAIIKAKSNWFTRILRNQRAMIYYTAVDSKKNHVFWSLKIQQARERSIDKKL